MSARDFECCSRCGAVLLRATGENAWGPHKGALHALTCACKCDDCKRLRAGFASACKPVNDVPARELSARQLALFGPDRQ